MSDMKNEGMRNSPVLWKDRKHFMWFPFSFTKYRIQNERLYKDVGLFTTVSDEVLLYRIIDMTLTRSLPQKIFGTGTLTVLCRMNREQTIELKNIKNPMEVKNYISKMVEELRSKHNVVGKEFYSAGMGGFVDADGNGIPDVMEGMGGMDTVPFSDFEG